MKKLIMVASIAVTAVATQAATINWNSGTLKGVASAEGGWGSTTITSGSVSGYLFVLDQTAYDKLYNSDVKTLSSNVYNAYKDNLASAKASKSTGVMISLNDGNSTYTTGDRQYAALLYILTDNDKTYYIGNVGDTGALKSSSNLSKANMALNVGGTGGTSMTSVGWQSVPEPTSAMLLMLGLCGLALKRKNV